ncbi:MAG: phosphate ABC transporter permease subunit PstC [Xanthomonadales bacterium]|nr:phosphate ABC transporter permease subunit PstC [Xanthomonadales bacterium]
MGDAVLRDSTPRRNLRRRRFRSPSEAVVEAGLLLAALSAVGITAAIVFILLFESAGFFSEVSILTFLTDTQWTPLFANARYGILPLLSGTLMTSLIALVFAVPLGTVTAVYLSEFASARVREVVKPILELIAGVPTVVFGYFALLFVTPMLQKIIPGLPGFNMLGPGLVIGIMIVPYISSLSEDAMRSVPMHFREASYAMGASRFQTAFKVVMPAATSGIVASYILGVSRAVGETMVVAIAAGQQPNMTFNPTEAAATITAYIVQVSMGDVPHDSLAYRSIFAAGLTLFVVTLVFNVIGYFVRKRYREAY